METTVAFEDLLSAIPTALILIDLRGRVVLANPAARDLLGSGGEGRSYVALIRQPDTLDCIETALRHRRRATARFMRASAASETTWRTVAAPVAAGGFEGVLASFEDISHIEEAEAMRRDFVANISHELRSPLTALTGFIETLRGSARHDAEARDRFLAIMEHEAQRMNRMVRDLLSLSKVEINERVRPRAPVDLPAVLRSAVAALRPMIEASGLTLDLTLDEAIPTVPGDADQLSQLFHNLIENAAKYGAAGGRVAVDAATPCRSPGRRRFCPTPPSSPKPSAKTSISRPRSSNPAARPPACAASAKASAKTPSTSPTPRARSATARSRPAPRTA
jgi:two-component system phosphate regulon sensor histidine kinase PhoR